MCIIDMSLLKGKVWNIYVPDGEEKGHALNEMPYESAWYMYTCKR